MSRLKETFSKLNSINKKALSIFLMSGYPDYSTSLELMHLCANNGADFLEIGMPFSDPSADGPTIKKAGEHALLGGAKIKKTIELIKEFRKTNNSTPIVWMGYFNSIYNYGIEKFLKDIDDAGVDGLLAVDLPVEESKRIENIKNYDIDLIRMITPTTKKERIDKILKDAQGFVYFVSIAGITGTKDAQEEKIRSSVEYVKSQTNIPILVGFGVKNGQKARQINAFADGVIVGSAVVNKISNNISEKNKMFCEIKNFLQEFD